jgi:tetratricopeptide (TPR) repeat protein
VIELLLEAESALSLGLLDRAEILYRQVAGADPRNSIAVVGLARVMLERGDEAGALKQARRALAIDAENTAAQRMVQRLEEVLEYRLSEGLPAAVGVGSRLPAQPVVTARQVAPPESLEAPESPNAQPPESPNAQPPESPNAQPPEPPPTEPRPPAAPSPPPSESSPEARTARSRSIIDRLLRRRR